MCAEQLTFHSIIDLQWDTSHTKNHFSVQKKPQSVCAAKVPPTHLKIGKVPEKQNGFFYIIIYFIIIKIGFMRKRSFSKTA